jgi:hypothetical protein
MNFVDLSIQFQAEVSEENPGASNVAPGEDLNHPHSEQMRVLLYFRPSDVIIGKQAGTAQDAVRKAFVTVERHVFPKWENVKKYLRPPATPDMQAGYFEDIGILVGEVYDERIIQDSLLHQGENPIAESAVTSNQNKKG